MQTLNLRDTLSVHSNSSCTVDEFFIICRDRMVYEIVMSSHDRKKECIRKMVFDMIAPMGIVQLFTIGMMSQKYMGTYQKSEILLSIINRIVQYLKDEGLTANYDIESSYLSVSW